jgi:diadenylate cyclase
MESALLQTDWLKSIFSGFWPIFFQFAILATALYYVHNKFIRHTNADHLVKGLFIVLMLLIGLSALAQKFNFIILEYVIKTSTQFLMFSLIVVLQPELRRILLFFGQNDWLAFKDKEPATTQWVYSDPRQVVKALSDAVRFLSRSKTGALIVLDVDSESNVEEHVLEMGTPLNALLSSQLLLTIFHPNTPLHDGAVIIGYDNHIISAGVLLPLTEDPNLSWRYGTRHRAAIGLTELCNCVCLVVSEETGNISFVQGGNIIKLGTTTDLIKRLEALYTTEVEETTEQESNNPFVSPVGQLMRVVKNLRGKKLPFWKRWS